MNKKNANKVVWVEYWIEHMDQSREIEPIDAVKDDNGSYKCVIDLPVINQKVEVINNNHVEAVLEAVDKACELIEEFTEKNPNNVVHNPYRNYEYEIYVDKDDNLFVEINSKCRKKIGKELQEAQSKAMTVINKAIDDIQKIYGLSDQLYLHITSKDIYDNSMKVEDIWELQEMEIEKNTNRVFVPIISYEKDKYIVTVAHLGRKA